ncbi:MAG: hypothetical protein ACKVY0_12175 [Prosthecobacter sp.]|uniref:hypothetical protein n=1 Tax=Prosthecobacter sp. TaxID=1965333 RepID=UPI0039044524
MPITHNTSNDNKLTGVIIGEGVQRCTRRAKENGWKFSELIVGIVTNPIFNHRDTEGTENRSK